MTNKKAIAAMPAHRTRAADPSSMMRATVRANSAKANKSLGYYHGNLGDSIERRFDGGLGGGGGMISDGSMGMGLSYPAQGYGNFYGTGMGYGPWNRYGPWAAEFGGNSPFKFLKRFSGNAGVYHSILASCQLAYWGDGIIKNVVDLYTDFASEGLTIVHEDESVQNFFNTWAKKVHLSERVQTILMTYFCLGNVFIHRRWATLSDEDKSRLRRSQAKLIGNELHYEYRGKLHKVRISDANQLKVLKKKVLGKAVAENITEETVVETQPNRIPWEYVLLNPLQMELRGRKFKNQSRWVIGLDKRDVDDIKKQYRGTIDLGSTFINIPSELEGRLKQYQGVGNGFAAEVPLGPDELSVVQDRKFDWCDWSIPLIFPALKSVNFKSCLRNMEMRACESVINSVFLFKLGNTKDGMPAEDEHFERLADMLQQPGQVLNILWNDLISAEVITTDVSKLFDPKKHESADRDILVALGVPEALIGGNGSSFANSFAGAATLLERIETARMRVEEWLIGELKLICDAMNFRKMPEVRWGKTSLRDKHAERQLVIQLYDRGLLSPQYLHEEFETSTDIEAARNKQVKPLIEDGTFKPRGPYIKPLDEANLDKKLPQPQTDPLKVKTPALAPGIPGTKPNKKTPNGRPGGTKEPGGRGPQNNPRPPTGRNIAELLERYDNYYSHGSQILDVLEKHISTKLIDVKYKAKGFKSVKELPQEERDRLEDLIFTIFSHISPETKSNQICDDFIINLLNSSVSAGVKAEVLSAYQKRIANYISEYGKEPSKDHRRQMMTSSWTQIAIQTS